MKNPQTDFLTWGLQFKKTKKKTKATLSTIILVHRAKFEDFASNTFELLYFVQLLTALLIMAKQFEISHFD